MRCHCLLLISLMLGTYVSFSETAAIAGPKKELSPAKEVIVNTEPVALPKPLDLSVPFKEDKDSSLKIEHKTQVELEEPTLFANEHKIKTRAVRLDGRLLMTQEQEVEKRKSIDGAGIVINLGR